MIGAPGDNPHGTLSGSAYVYVRNASGVWTFQAKLSPTDGATQHAFGHGVAIVGNTVLVGAPYGNAPAAANSGAAYVYVRSGTTWSQQAS